MSTLWREKIARGVYAVETEERHGRGTRTRVRVIVKRGGARSSKTVQTRSEALRIGREVARELEREESAEMSDVLVEYREHLQRKGLKGSTVTATMHRLEGLCSGVEYVPDLSTKTCQRLYEAYAETHSPTTSLNVMGQARTFGRWCIRRGYLKHNHWEDVETYGRRKRGKPQLTGEEARRLVRVCLGDAGARGGVVLSALLLGLRASEIAAIAPRDIDGATLWVRGTKTANAARRVEVPDVLRDLLPKVAGAKVDRYKVRSWCQQLCRKAGVPVMGPHSLRATHATLARSAGATSELVAAQLGHGSTTVTEGHYIAPGTSEAADRRSALRLLVGGLDE